MSFVRKLKRAIRGEVSPKTATLEILRRADAAIKARNERNSLAIESKQPAHLCRPYSDLNDEQLLEHFQTRQVPRSLPGLKVSGGSSDSERVIHDAAQIVDQHCWEILGFGTRSFVAGIEWNRDLLSGYEWPLTYHRNLTFLRLDGSDARVVWELNRLGHLVPLAAAYATTLDDRFLRAFFTQLDSWKDQNPFGYGVNWACAMEVALRAINLLAAFEIFRRSSHLTRVDLTNILNLLQLHGRHIRRNLEYSYIATSNHYMTDVVGLVWLGVSLPELSEASSWREFGLREMLREIDKQILPDGADFEASTGYHRLILELLLYTFILCKENNIEIPEQYWAKLHRMLEFTRVYLRPDGLAPLIGDTDSGQVLPFQRRRANDHAYLLSVGAVVFNDARLKVPGMDAPDELRWIVGAEGVESFKLMTPKLDLERSRAFPDAGIYVMRDRDLYLCFNASGAGVHGRGSHGHNDVLSIEVSAFGIAFICDPGTFVYGANREARHAFRSTRYHSTVQIDDEEQNTTDINVPFVIGNEAQPEVLHWESNEDLDIVVAEHHGYRRFESPVTHRRTVTFDKKQRTWSLVDDFAGDGDHEFAVRFHFSPDLDVRLENSTVVAKSSTGKSLHISSLVDFPVAELEELASSRDYGEKRPSKSACWRIRGGAGRFEWRITPVDDLDIR